MKKIKIVLADDHEIFRNGVEHLINNEEDMEVVDTAGNGKEAIEKCMRVQPDIVLMDISMPGMNGLEAAARLIQNQVAAGIILFSLYDRQEYISQALHTGVKGYILKDASNHVFLKAIRQVYLGHYFYSGDLTHVLVSEYYKLQPAENQLIQIPESHIRLSAREIEILQYIKDGKNNKELSGLFHVSTRTIETHRLNIMRKLRVKQIEAAIKTALDEGIIS